MRKALLPCLRLCFLIIWYLKMKHSPCLISEMNVYRFKAVLQMCWKWPFLRGPGTIPNRMSLALGSVTFRVIHSLCCFMALFTCQDLFLQRNPVLLDTQNLFLLGGNTLWVRIYMKLPVLCLSRICKFDPWPQRADIIGYWATSVFHMFWFNVFFFLHFLIIDGM